MPTFTRLPWESRDAVHRPLTATATRPSTGPYDEAADIVVIASAAGGARPSTAQSRYNPEPLSCGVDADYHLGDGDDGDVDGDNDNGGAGEGGAGEGLDTSGTTATLSDDSVASDSDTRLDGEFDGDESSADAYRAMCDKIGVVPARHYERHMTSETFAMNDHGLGPHGAAALCSCLQHNKHVRHVELRGNAIRGAGMRHVVAMLAKNHNITSLDVRDNSLGSAGAAHATAHFDTGRSALEAVDLGGNGLLDSDAAPLFDALRHDSALHVLRLARNRVGDVAAKPLGALLADGALLTEIDLEGNSVRRRGAEALAAGVAESVALTTLNLGSNGVGNDGAAALARALVANSALTTLLLPGNNVGDAGASALAAAAGERASHADPVALDVSRNPVTSSGMIPLLGAVADGRVASLAFDGVALEGDALAALARARQANPSATIRGDFPTFEGFDGVRDAAVRGAAERAARRAAGGAGETAAERALPAVPGADAPVGTDPESVDAAPLDAGSSDETPGESAGQERNAWWKYTDEQDEEGDNSGAAIEPPWQAAVDSALDTLAECARHNYLRLEDLFLAADAARRGWVTADELARAVRLLDSHHLTRAEATAVVSHVDADADGRIHYGALLSGRGAYGGGSGDA